MNMLSLYVFFDIGFSLQHYLFHRNAFDSKRDWRGRGGLLLVNMSMNQVKCPSIVIKHCKNAYCIHLLERYIRK